MSCRGYTGGYIPGFMPSSAGSEAVIPSLFRFLVLGGPALAAALSCSSPPREEAPAAVSAAGGAEGRFVGSEACRACHAAEYGAWSGSRHRTAMTAPAPGRAP